MDILTMLKKQAEQVEVFNLENEKTTVEYEANQLKACAVTRTKGTAVRVICKGRLGFSASTDRMVVDKLAANGFNYVLLNAYAHDTTWSKGKMAAYKYPRIVEFVKELPKTASGKVLKRVLREKEVK